jgi:hypothetical protein
MGEDKQPGSFHLASGGQPVLTGGPPRVRANTITSRRAVLFMHPAKLYSNGATARTYGVLQSPQALSFKLLSGQRGSSTERQALRAFRISAPGRLWGRVRPATGFMRVVGFGVMRSPDRCQSEAGKRIATGALLIDSSDALMLRLRESIEAGQPVRLGQGWLAFAPQPLTKKAIGEKTWSKEQP